MRHLHALHPEARCIGLHDLPHLRVERLGKDDLRPPGVVARDEARVGRDGGAVRQLADASVLLPTVDPKLVTPQTEGLQALVWHLIVSHPSLASSIAKWEGLDTPTPANA